MSGRKTSIVFELTQNDIAYKWSLVHLEPF